MILVVELICNKLINFVTWEFFIYVSSYYKIKYTSPEGLILCEIHVS